MVWDAVFLCFDVKEKMGLLKVLSWVCDFLSCDRLRVVIANLDNNGGTKVAACCRYRFLC